MKYKTGEEFLNKLYQNMYLEEVVMHTSSISDTPTERIEKYLKRLEDVHEKAKNNSHNMDLLKSFYYKKYVIKELPESYFELQKKILREQGNGNIELSDEERNEMIKNIQNDQKKSLDNWVEYFCSDDAMYPMWFKNYAFQGMLKLGKFNKEKGDFVRRTASTIAPFLELNREVLAQVYASLEHTIGKSSLSLEEEKALNNGESFKKLYTYYLRKFILLEANDETDGIWIKYNQGDDYLPLWKSLQGKNTGWCTAGNATCKAQIEDGDFYVYYTKDKSGEYKDPRIAIRMDGNVKIGEVRGIANDQNIEDVMLDITEEKLKEFPDKDDYQKKVHDMKYLTEIDNKVKQNQELTKEELIFLYEIDTKIKGFGWHVDPRIKEIKSKRNKKKDFAQIFDCRENQVATSITDFEKNDIVVYLGNLKWRDTLIPESFKNLRFISGCADFGNLVSAKGLENLQVIGGYAAFRKLEITEGLDNLQLIGGFASFENLLDSRGLEKLRSIGGNAYFYKLLSAKGLKNLQSIEWDAFFNSLTEAIGLGNLKSIGRNAKFYSLVSAKGLENLNSIGGYANFGNLINAEGLESLQIIGRDAIFSSLMRSNGLGRLEAIHGIAHFESLREAKNLINLKLIEGSACFYSLLNIDGLGNLKSVGGRAHFGKETDRILKQLTYYGGNEPIPFLEVPPELLDEVERVIIR